LNARPDERAETWEAAMQTTATDTASIPTHSQNEFRDARAPLAGGPRRDTKAWQAQVWVSFLTAAGLCGTGLAYLPGQDIERVFMVMGYGFSLSAAFMLSKHVRDNELQIRDTPLWGLMVWLCFALAMALTGWGIAQMGINPTYKAYLGASWLFLMSAAFTLAKTLRDRHEADLAEARWEGARAAAGR
jgi:hypothetical protein